MKLQKIFLHALLGLVVAAGFTACSDDETTPGTNPVNPIQPVLPGRTTAYVVNQGNQYGGITGSLDVLSLTDHTVTSGVFKTVNDRALGDTPQKPVRYGDKIYVPVFGSNLVEVINAKTMKSVTRISVSNPEAVCGAGEYVYVASNDGYVVRADTTAFQISNQLAVGPNPMGLTAANGYVYVTISDSYNYQGENAYANGKKVVVIQTANFAKAKEIPVGTNPTQILSNEAGELFLVASGNFSDIPSTVQKVATDGTVTDLCSGSVIALHGDTLIVGKTAYDANWKPTATYSYVVLSTGKITENFIPAGESFPTSPATIDVNPSNGHVFICSDVTAYNEPGAVFEYGSVGTGAALVHTYAVGVHPYGVVFE